MIIPEKHVARVRYLAKLNYLEKQHQAQLADRELSPDNDVAKRCHEELDGARDLFEIVDPLEAERLRTMQPAEAA